MANVCDDADERFVHRGRPSCPRRVTGGSPGIKQRTVPQSLKAYVLSLISSDYLSCAFSSESQYHTKVRVLAYQEECIDFVVLDVSIESVCSKRRLQYIRVPGTFGAQSRSCQLNHLMCERGRSSSARGRGGMFPLLQSNSKRFCPICHGSEGRAGDASSPSLPPALGPLARPQGDSRRHRRLHSQTDATSPHVV